MLKPLTDYEWVRLACSEDEARPILTGVHVRREPMIIEATNGHLLHQVHDFQGCDLSDGTWVVPYKADGTYPHTEQVVSEAGASTRRRFTEIGKLTVLLKLQAELDRKLWHEGSVALPTDQQGILAWVSPKYLLSILRGQLRDDVVYQAAGPLTPLRFDVSSSRVAVVMPIRLDNNVINPSVPLSPLRRDLSAYVEEVR